MQLFRPDPDLPATRVLFDTTAVATRVASWQGAADPRVSIADIRYKPHTSCVVSYRIESEGVNSFVHAKGFRVDDWLIRKQKLRQDSGNVFLDDQDCFALFKFPSDQALPGLKYFIDDPDQFLSRIMFQRFTEEAYHGYESLAYKPNRRFTARVSLQSGRSLVLKIHDASTFEHVLRSSKILKHSLSVETPDRMGRSHRYRAFAHEWIEGCAIDFSKQNVSQGLSIVEKILEYLDRLHISPAESGQKLTIEGREGGIESLTDFLAEILPSTEIIARKICKEILANQPTTGELTLIHGDFHERQVLLTKNDVCACDFDNCCLGDATSDLANFVAHLEYRVCLNELSIEFTDQVNEIATRKFSQQGDRTANGRYQWGRIAALFRLATHPFRSGDANWIEHTEQILNYVAKQIEWQKYTSIAVSRPESTTAIQRDPQLSFLRETFDARTVSPIFQEHLPAIEAAYGSFEVVDIVARRHKPGRRCLIEYELLTERGPVSILGKVSAKRLDRRTFETQTQLHELSGFGYECADGICVPRPMGYFAPWKMWFQEVVNAESGRTLVKENRLATVTQRISATAAKLHHSGFCPSRFHTIEDELNILRDRLNVVMNEVPECANRIESILGNCFVIGNSIDAQRPMPIHRDFYQDQILFSENQTFLVDLDLVAWGHPAVDIGNFLAHLTEHGIRRHGNADYWHVEECEIAQHFVTLSPEVTREEIAALKAISLARHVFLSWSRPDRRESMPKIIDTAEALTDGLVTSRVTFEIT